MTWKLVVHGGLTVVVAVLAGVGLIGASDALAAALITLPTLAALTGLLRATARHTHPTRRQTRDGMVSAAVAAAVTLVAVAAVGGLAVLAGGATGPILLLIGFVSLGWAWTHRRKLLDRVLTVRVGRRPTPLEPDERWPY